MRAHKGATRRKAINRPKKCPVCGSTRVKLKGNDFFCRRCRYKNMLERGP